MKLTPTVRELNVMLKGIAGLQGELQQTPVRFSLSADSISAFDHNGLEIGFVNTSGTSIGSGWIQNKNHDSETIHVADLLA